MLGSSDRGGESEALRVRLSHLRDATVRIDESIDFDTLPGEVLDAALELCDAPLGVITLARASGELEQVLVSGFTPDQARDLPTNGDGSEILNHLQELPGPLRVPDFPDYIRSLVPEFDPPTPIGAFLSAPMQHRGETIGSLLLARDPAQPEFTGEDEETLVMFASHAAHVIVNARRHRDEQRARDDLEALVNTAPVAVVVFDVRAGVQLSLNHEAERIVRTLQRPGEPADKLPQGLIVRRADGQEFPLDVATVARLLSEGQVVQAEEVVVQAPNGSSITVLMNATPIRYTNGELESIVITLQDLTPLEELDRLRLEFLSMVSHEMQMPLTSIKGSTSTLLKDYGDLDPAEMRQFLRIIDNQVDSMSDLTSDLLDMAHIQTGTLSVDPQPVYVERLVDEAKNRFLASGRRNPLQIELAPGLPPVRADARRIVQVIDNLLSNAARHSAEDSPIRVVVDYEDVHVAVAVVDEGAGLDPESLSRVFQTFTRIDPQGRRRGTAGAGLGLAICRGIVEAHGGRIRAESDGLQRGSRFTFTLPVDGDAAGADSLPLPVSRESDRSDMSVLAVDDDPYALRYMREVVTREGYAAIVTGDPEEVLSLVEQRRPDLVLLDLMLPGTDGFRLMSEILEISDAPIIFVSVYGQDEYIVRAFDMGATDYVVKPCSDLELAARIRAALRRRPTTDPIKWSEPYRLGDLTIDFVERGVTVAGEPVELTPTEYRVLAELASSAGQVITHRQLLERVWDIRDPAGTGPVRNIMFRLRHKLGDDPKNPRYLFSEPRIGYRMGTAGGEAPRRSPPGVPPPPGAPPLPDAPPPLA